MNLLRWYAEILWGFEIVADFVQGLPNGGNFFSLIGSCSNVIDEVDAHAVMDDDVIFTELRKCFFPKLDTAFQTLSG